MKSVRKKIILFACVIFCFFTLTLTVSADNGSTIVYITDSGEKYHTAGCQYLSRSKNSITLQEADEEGYSPCSKCNPQVYDGGSTSGSSSITSENILPDTYSSIEDFEDKDVSNDVNTPENQNTPDETESPSSISQIPTAYIVQEIIIVLIVAYGAYTYGKKRQADAIDSDYDRISKELETINSSFQERFGRLRNPLTGERIKDAKSYLRALDAQDMVRENRKAERETELNNK